MVKLKVKKDPELERLENLYYSFGRRGDRLFSKKDFIEWYIGEVKKDSCHYCGISLQMQRDVIEKELLKSKRFFSYSNQRDDGSVSKGTRGRSFEVDRKIPKGPYSKDNCVLVCYFCNNDKSDVFTSEQYLAFIGGTKGDKKDNPRYRFIESLLKKK
jgi:hypothetical protein